MKLLSGQTANTDAGDAGTLWSGGSGFLAMTGALGASTLQMQFSPDSGATWFSVGAGYTTVGALGAFSAPRGHIRPHVTGADGSTDITLWALPGDE